ncbi:hypothetical protein Tco_0332748 [Tanacetum coccineum]
MQRPPLFESDSFIYWKNRFETYVKSKDLDLWHVITNGDFQPIIQNPETKLDEVVPFEKQSDELKRRLAKNNEAKMVIYNALPRKEYERIFMCNMEKDIWKTLLITHQDESIDSAFARFNTIITSLKSLDEGYSTKNYVRKFFRALHPKWRAKVTGIEELDDLTSLSLDELIRNLKVYEMIIKKDSKIVKAKVERESLDLKAKKESSDEECSTSGSEDEEYAIAIPNHLIGECPKPPRDKNQKAFVGGSWSDSGEEDDKKVNNEACLVAQAPNEVCSESSYFSDENSSIDDLALDNEYDKLCKMSLKIITKNKRLKATRNSLEKEIRELKDKLSTLKKNKGVDLEYTICQSLKIENEKLKEEALKLTKFEKSTHCLNEMLSNQKPSGDKLGLGFNSFEASSSGTKEIKFVKAQKKVSSDGGPINMGGPESEQAAPKIIMGPPPATPVHEKCVSFQKSILGPRPKHIIVNNVKVPVASDNVVKQFYKPLSKPGVGFSKPNLRSKNPPPRRANTNYPHAKTPQPKRNVGRQNQPHGFPICLGVDLEPDEWIKDSGCSKHMTGNRKLFSTYKAYNGGNIIFGSNLRGQICDNKCRVTFSEHDSEITKDGKVIGTTNQKIHDKAKQSCMVSFRQLHSNLKLLSNNNLNGTRTESGFKRAFATLFGQDVETFIGTMFLNLDQLEKQIDKEEFQEIGSSLLLKYSRPVLDVHSEFTDFYLDDEFVTDANNKEKVDTSKALNASLVDTRSSETKSKEQDKRNDPGNVLHMLMMQTISPLYDEGQWLRYKRLLNSMSLCYRTTYTEQSNNSNNEGRG